MENHSLIERIKNKDREEALKEIYRNHRNEFLLWAVKNNACTMDEAKEVFQQSMVILYENIINEKLTELSVQLKTYLYSIGKNKIFELLRNKNKTTALQDDQYGKYNDIYFNEMDGLYEEKLLKVKAGLDLLGDPCKSILIQFYYHNRNLDDLNKIMEYKNKATLRNLKYKCLQRLKQIVKSEFDVLY